jgi:protein SCO1/2
MKIKKNANRLTILLALALPIFLILMIITPFEKDAEANNLSEEIRDLLVEPPVPVQPFELLDDKKQPFNTDRLKNAWTLMFFGYTHCPDVCPTTLTELDNAASQLKNLKTGSRKIQYVFVSIDPKRDTLDLLADYVSYFGAKFISVTGEHEQLKRLANPLGIQYKIGIGFNKEYIVNHSSAMLLIDPQGRYYARFKAPHYSEEISAGVKRLIQYYGEIK